MANDSRFTKPLLLRPLLLDCCALLLLSVIFLWMPELALQPYRRGFFCDDQSIRLPFKGDTVTPALLATIILVMLFGTVAAAETYQRFTFARFDEVSYLVSGHQVHRCLIRFCTYTAYGMFGLLVNLILCEVTKYAVGRLRPHFIDVCRPNINLTVCEQPLIYITNYTCTGNLQGYERGKDIRLSFFSGHSSMSMHVAVYCAIYLHTRLPRRLYGISLLPIFQLLHIVVALLIGYSRISDHKHHYSDVAVGFSVGVFTGVVSAIYLARLLSRQPFTSRGKHPTLHIDTENLTERRNTLDIERNEIQAQALHLPTADVITAQETRDGHYHDDSGP